MSQPAALITAAPIPMSRAPIKTPLPTPPLVRLEKERKKPISPNRIATIARTNPQNAPVVKLRMAATIAMIDGMLNLAFGAPVVSMQNATPVAIFPQRRDLKGGKATGRLPGTKNGGEASTERGADDASGAVSDGTHAADS